MRKLILIIGIAVMPHHSFAQNRWKFFLDEFQISANRTVFKENNSDTGFGYGFGAYHTFRSENILNLQLGLEYNRISQFKDYIYEGRFKQAYDVTLVANCISLSLGPRFNIGTNTKVFFDAGIYADLVVKSRMTGERDSCSFEKEGLICRRIQINEDAGLSNTAGIYIGGGLCIPVSTIELIVSADYRHGLNPTSYTYASAIYHRYLRIKLGIRIN